MNLADVKRLFFGAEIEAPWPKDYPPARMIPEKTRHITLAFLGQIPFLKLQGLLPEVPKPPFEIGPAGVGKELVFLPADAARVAALSVEWFDVPSSFEIYQQMLAAWLKSQGYPLDERPFFSHASVARSPFDKTLWQEHFTPLPLFVRAIHLYQSMGNLEYKSLWEIPLLAPFDEFEHTADIAFTIRGNTPEQIHRSAELALAFKFPLLVEFFAKRAQSSLEEIVIALNETVGKADGKYGCPFKAISFHGKIHPEDRNILYWEMIVDV